MKKTIITRSQNDYLYNIMKDFWSPKNEFFIHKEFTGYQGAKDFISNIFKNYSGIVVVCDEDMFITDESAIDSMIETMTQNNYGYVGIQDGGGLIAHRYNSKYNINPFFAIFDLDKIKPKFEFYDPSKDKEYGLKCEINPKFNEPYAGLFYWLNKEVFGANLIDLGTTDGTSTVIRYFGKIVGIHSWYSREYGKDKEQTERIDKCIEYALKTKYKVN